MWSAALAGAATCELNERTRLHPAQSCCLGRPPSRWVGGHARTAATRSTPQASTRRQGNQPCTHARVRCCYHRSSLPRQLTCMHMLPRLAGAGSGRGAACLPACLPAYPPDAASTPAPPPPPGLLREHAAAGRAVLQPRRRPATIRPHGRVAQD